MLGRTNVSVPVCHSRTAPPCRELEQCIELITHRSSANSARCGKERADPDAALAVLAELERRADEIAHAIREREHPRAFLRRERPAAVAREQRLGIKRIEVRRAPDMNSMITRLTRGAIMRLFDRQRIGRCVRRRERPFRQQRRQGQTAETRPHLLEKLAARPRMTVAGA